MSTTQKDRSDDTHNLGATPTQTQQVVHENNGGHISNLPPEKSTDAIPNRSNSSPAETPAHLHSTPHALEVPASNETLLREAATPASLHGARALSSKPKNYRVSTIQAESKGPHPTPGIISRSETLKTEPGDTTPSEDQSLSRASTLSEDDFAEFGELEPRDLSRSPTPSLGSRRSYSPARDSITEGDQIQLFPSNIDCRLYITFDDRPHELIDRDYPFPHFLWHELESYTAITRRCKEVIQRIKESMNLQDVNKYLRYGFCYIKGSTHETKHSTELSVTSDEDLPDAAIRQICGFIRDYPYQRFELIIRCDYSFIQTQPRIDRPIDDIPIASRGADAPLAASSTSQLRRRKSVDSFTGMMLVQYNNKIKIPRPNIHGQPYFSRADLNALADPDIAARIIDECKDLEERYKIDLKAEVNSRPASILHAVCVYERLSMEFLYHILLEPPHKDEKHSDMHPPSSDQKCADFECQKYHDQFVKSLYKFAASTVSYDRWFHKRHDDEVVPIRYTGDQPRKLGDGSFGQVFEVDIDPAHCGEDLSTDISQTYALKIFGKETRHTESFEREIRMLLYLGLYPHNHILTHITSWYQKDNYYILYEKATCNLREYMSKEPGGDLSSEKVLWFLRQLRGLADAICRVHQFRQPKEAPFPTKHSPSNSSRKKRVVGYHHDLKPENILVFTKPDRLPILKISDFGAGKFSTVKGQASARGATEVRGTQTYAGPECHPDKKTATTRPYDMWALGCIYTELLLWFFGIEKPLNGKYSFAELRCHEHRQTMFAPDYFWFRSTHFLSGLQGSFVLNPAVDRILTDLYNKTCKDMRAFIDIISFIRELLQIKTTDRPTAVEMYSKVDTVLTQAELDLKKQPDAYLIRFKKNMQHEEVRKTSTPVTELPTQMAVPQSVRADISVGPSRQSSREDLRDQYDILEPDPHTMLVATPHGNEITTNVRDGQTETTRDYSGSADGDVNSESPVDHRSPSDEQSRLATHDASERLQDTINRPDENARQASNGK